MLYDIRSWQTEDLPALKALWKIAFGDSDKYIDGFFERFLTSEDACVVAVSDDRVVSAMYILPAYTFPYRKKHLSAGYTYALATLPEYRGRGIGGAVYQAADKRAKQCADLSCVLPAEEPLYPFYEKLSGARPFGGIREAHFTREELAPFEPCMSARISVEIYAGIREQLLSGLRVGSAYPADYALRLSDSHIGYREIGLTSAAAEKRHGKSSEHN